MNTFTRYLIFLLVMSAILFFLMGSDKKRAKTNRWRIPEKTLFAFAVLGGAVGGCLGMKIFHHKTKHWYFQYGFPILAVLQIFLAFFLFLK